MRFKDLTGQTFGEWEVLEYLGDKRYLCRCSCGVEKAVATYSLTGGKSKNCGKSIHKINGEKAFKDLTGQTFGELNVVKYLGNRYWECLCSCGHTTKVESRKLTKTSTCRECRYNKIRKPKEEKMPIIKQKATHVGDKFRDLTVIEDLGNDRYICRCECGIIREVRGYSLRHPFSDNAYRCRHKFKIGDRVGKLTILGLGMTAVYEYIHRYNLSVYISREFSSKYEREIVEFIGTLIPRDKIKLHDIKVLSGKELDIYIPDKQLAIEFNGIYWHDSEHKDRYYHQNKVLDCAKLGIRLIQVYENEWNNIETKEKIKSLLSSLIDDKREKLYGRNLTVDEVDWAEIQGFEEMNHLQGAVKSKINIVLKTDKNEIVGAMTFGRPRFTGEYEFEILRLCYDNKYKVIGGTQKMFKYFVNKYRPTSVITYTNIDKFTGNIYLRLGFNLTENPVTKPNYYWVMPGTFEVLTRYQTTKKKLINAGFGNVDMTEDDIMKSLGYIKIYDSGNLRLEYINNE